MSIAELREDFFNILNKFELPIFLQGSMSENIKYPHTFITYFIPEYDHTYFGDNDCEIKTAILEIAIYSEDVSEIDRLSEEIKKEMKINGYNYVIGGDVASDEKTHTGYMQRFSKML